MSRVTSPNCCFSDNVKFMVMMNFEFKVLIDIHVPLYILSCFAVLCKFYDKLGIRNQGLPYEKKRYYTIVYKATRSSDSNSLHLKRITFLYTCSYVYEVRNPKLHGILSLIKLSTNCDRFESL